MNCIKKVLALVLAGGVAQPVMAAGPGAENVQGYLCHTSFPENASTGWRPEQVAFQLIEGRSRVPASDPLNYYRGKIATARTKTGADGRLTLTWRVPVPTSEGYSMGGSIRVNFNPVTRGGTIRTSIPARLTGGGSLDGRISCEREDFSALVRR